MRLCERLGLSGLRLGVRFAEENLPLGQFGARWCLIPHWRRVGGGLKHM